MYLPVEKILFVKIPLPESLLFYKFINTNIKACYKTHFFIWIICEYHKRPYLCNVFFIVLDLRLTKVGARRCSFFYVYTSDYIFSSCLKTYF